MYNRSLSIVLGMPITKHVYSTISKNLANFKAVSIESLPPFKKIYLILFAFNVDKIFKYSLSVKEGSSNFFLIEPQKALGVHLSKLMSFFDNVFTLIKLLLINPSIPFFMIKS